MKWGYKQGVASIKTLDNLLRFRKYREDFNQGREQDTAASVHDVFLFIINFFLVKFCIQDPRHCTVIYYQQFLTMFSIRKSDFLSTSAQSVANFKVYPIYSIMKGHGNGLNDFCTVWRRRLVNQILLKTLKWFANLF